MSDVFKNATKKKYRFNYRGICTVEDLWDLSVKDLDAIYKSMKKQEKDNNGESLLVTKTKEDKVLAEKIEIVTEIVKDKLEEIDKQKTAAANRAEKMKILEIIADKENAELKEKSIDDLKAMLENLNTDEE